MDVLQELSEDFLTCSICLQRYNEPKQLSCLHSFCRKCLSSHIKATDKGGIIAFPCPICRKITSPASSLFSDPADDFPDNFYIASLVSSLDKCKIKGNVESEEISQSKGDNCPNHPGYPSEVFCTTANVGVCHECQSSHGKCQEKHMPIHAAKTKVFSDISVLKVKMASLTTHSKRLNESLSESPINLRLRKQELLCEISKHFSEVKNIISKKLIEKEQEITNNLKELVKEEEIWAGEALDENIAITEACEKKLVFLEDQSTKRYINAIGTITSMNDQMKTFTDDLVRLEKESDVQLLKYTHNMHLDDILGQLSFGNVESVHTQDETPVEVTVDLQKPEEALNPYHIHSTVPSAPLPPTGAHYIPQYNPSYLPQSYNPQFAANLNPIHVPTHGEYKGAVLRLPQCKPPQIPNPNTENPNRVYLEHRSLSERVLDDNIKVLVPMAKISCRLPEDTRQCKFVGITSVAEDVFFVVDRWNKNLKLLKLKGPVVKSLQLQHGLEPWDATRVLSSSLQQVVVTCPSACIIFFAEYNNTKNQVSLRTQIKTRIGYASLGCINCDELVCGVCSPFGPPRIDIISMTGNIIRTFADMVTYPRSIDTSSSEVIAVSDWTRKHVLLIHDNGRTNSYTGGPQQKLIDPMGIAFYEDGSFLVADKHHGCLHKFTQHGQQEIVAKITDKVNILACVPVSSTFSKQGLAIVVGASDGCVYVYDGYRFIKEKKN